MYGCFHFYNLVDLLVGMMLGVIGVSLGLVYSKFFSRNDIGWVRKLAWPIWAFSVHVVAFWLCRVDYLWVKLTQQRLVFFGHFSLLSDKSTYFSLS